MCYLISIAQITLCWNIFFGFIMWFKIWRFYHIFFSQIVHICCYVILFIPFFFAPALVSDVDKSDARYIELKKEGWQCFSTEGFYYCHWFLFPGLMCSALLFYMDVTEILELHDWMWLESYRFNVFQFVPYIKTLLENSSGLHTLKVLLFMITL